MSNTQSHLIVKEEGICIYRQPIYPPMSRKQAQSFAILCEDQVKALSLIQKLYNLNHVHLGISYPVPGIEFEEIEVNIKWPKPPSSPADIKTVARLIEHTAEKGWKHTHNVTIESPEIDKEEEQLIWKHIYIDFRDGEGWINFAERMSQQFTIKTRKP